MSNYPELELVVHYDDTPDDVVESVNRILISLGMEFKIENVQHDGFNVYHLVRIE